MGTTYDVKTVAEILNVTEGTVRKYIKQSKLVGYKKDGKWRITMKSVKKFESK